MAQPSNNLKDMENVPYHKRIAMGANLDGTSLQSKGQQQQPKVKGGLSQAPKKK